MKQSGNSSARPPAALTLYRNKHGHPPRLRRRKREKLNKPCPSHAQIIAMRRWLIVQKAGHSAGCCDLTRIDRRTRNQRRAVANVGRCKPREVVYHIKWAQSILRAPRKQQEGKPAREEIDLRANGRSIHTLTSCAGSVEAIWRSNKKPATTESPGAARSRALLWVFR